MSPNLPPAPPVQPEFARLLKHTSTRSGLKKVDAVVDLDKGEPPAERFELPLPRRRRLFYSLFGWWIRRREQEAENRRLFYRLGSTIAVLEASIKQFKLVADQMMKAQARAEVRLAQLAKNHDVLRDVLNAQGEAVENLQKGSSNGASN